MIQKNFNDKQRYTPQPPPPPCLMHFRIAIPLLHRMTNFTATKKNNEQVAVSDNYITSLPKPKSRTSLPIVK